MNTRIVALLSLTVIFAGCVTGYTLVQPGPITVQDLQVNAGTGWNQAPNQLSPVARKGSQLWTQDGLLLDRIVIIPAVPDGETLVVSRSAAAALPVFRKDMLPNEIEELVESTLTKYFGEGEATVSTANLRPQTFGDNRGVMFDISAQVTDSPDYKGMIGAFIAEEKLYSVWYIAAEPHYYGKHSARAEAVIKSAALVKQ